MFADIYGLTVNVSATEIPGTSERSSQRCSSTLRSSQGCVTLPRISRAEQQSTYRRAQMTLVVAKTFVFEKYLQNIQRYHITHLT